jgi:single-stranded DNA-binding protein
MDDKNITLNDLNSVLLEGTVAKEPVISYDPNGIPRCLLFITSERYRVWENGREKQTTAMNVDTHGKIAEQCMKICHTGRKIRVVGSLRTFRGKNGKART